MPDRKLMAVKLLCRMVEQTRSIKILIFVSSKSQMSIFRADASQTEHSDPNSLRGLTEYQCKQKTNQGHVIERKLREFYKFTTGSFINFLCNLK